MRMFIKRKTALILALMLLVPFLWNKDVITVAAATATPSLTQSKLDLRGIGEVYDLNVKNKVAKSTYAWSTSSKSVATVTSKGIVTTVGTGIAMIKCKITYPTKKTKTLSCKVTVTVPATAINISDLPLVNNAYQLALGSTVDLNAVITPSTSTDTAYWYIDQDNMLSNPDSISLDSNNQGIVTGVKAGKAVVRVKAAATTAIAAADTNHMDDIDDAMIIEVVAPTATVKSADILSSNQIAVVFDSPIKKETVINTDNTLTSNITIGLCKDAKNVLADDPGKLTASLSTDNKTLYINATKSFEGTYSIVFSKGILTTTGVAIEEYTKQMSFTDTVAPFIVNSPVDETGMIATINFNEAIDFTNFAVAGAQVVSAGTSVTANSLSVLGNTANYVIAADKKSVSINMSTISATDYGKMFCIRITGIKDLAGNAPTNATLLAYLVTDTSPKPQAQLQYISRTSYNTVTAVFDRAIKTGGNLYISNGSQITGIVDTTDTKKVNFALSSTEMLYTGPKSVSIGYWNSYNVSSTDYSANTLITRTVDFTVETTSPFVTGNEFDATTNILTLTYSEPVSLVASSGVFLANRTTATEEVKNGLNISYAVVNHTLGNNIVKLKLTFNDTKTGIYTFTMPQGFATDSFMNLSISKTIMISNSTGSTELPGPYGIVQSLSNLSEITVMFANKVDLASAQIASNYKIAGVTVLSAVVTNNTSDTGATVVLTVQTIDATTDRPITITGVKGYNNSFTAITNYTTSVLLKENLGPIYLDPPVYDSVSKNIVKLNFSEAIQGTLSVTVTQVYGASSIVLTSTPVTISGNTASINLGTVPMSGSLLKITIVTNGITDAAGNKATFNTTNLVAVANY